jgi:hypothetical protein
MTMAATSAADAALTWTTAPPAKSSAPIEGRSRRPHPVRTGAYTATTHNTMKARYALKRMRSTTAPEINAGVMIATCPERHESR